MDRVHVRIDDKKCVLCGVCEAICPSVFSQTDEYRVGRGTVTIKQQNVTASNSDAILTAIEACPTDCIILESLK